MKPNTKSTLYDILTGISGAVVSFTILYNLPFYVGLVLMAPVPFIAGYIRGKDPKENKLIKVMVMNSFYYPAFLFTILFMDHFYYNLIILVAVGGTVLGIYARQACSTSTLKVTGFSALFFGSVALTGFWPLRMHLEAIMWTETRVPASEYKLLSPEGDTLYSNDHAGKVVVMDFWATWCGPCKAQFPLMERIVNRYKGNEQVVFLFVNADKGSDSFAKASEFIRKSPYAFPFVMDIQESTFKTCDIAVLPTILIIDKKGVVRLRHQGLDKSEQFYTSFCSQIDSLVAH